MNWEQFEDVAIEDKIAQLGEPTAEFALRGLGFLRNLVLAPLLVGAGIALEVLLIGLLHVHHLELLLLGIVLMLSGVMLVVRAFRNRGLRVLVFPEGLVRFRQGEAQALCWEEIDKVWHNQSEVFHWARQAWRGTLTLTVQAADGRRMIFDDSLPRLLELGRIVRHRTLPFLLLHARAEYEAGKTLDFGKLRISQRGLSQGKENIPWSDVQKLKSNGAELLVYKKGKWTHHLRSAVSDIPNFHLLLAMLKQLVPVEDSSSERGSDDAMASDCLPGFSCSPGRPGRGASLPADPGESQSTNLVPGR